MHYLPPPNRLPPDLWEQLAVIDKVHLYWLCANRILGRWSSSFPFSVHFSTEVGLLTFLLLRLMPLHPLSIVATIGGSLSLAFVSLLIDIIIRRLVALFRTASQVTSSPTAADDQPFQRFARISRWATLPIIGVAVHDPRLVALTFYLLTPVMAVSIALLLYTLLRRVDIDMHNLKDNLLAIAVCILFASLLNLVPNHTGMAVSVASVTAGVFFVFYTICWLFSLSKMTLSAIAQPVHIGR